MNGFTDRVREPIAVGCHPPLAVPFRYLLRNLWRSAFATAWSNRCVSVLSVAPCTRFLVGGRADLLEHRAAFDFQRPCRWSDKFLEVLGACRFEDPHPGQFGTANIPVRSRTG